MSVLMPGPLVAVQNIVRSSLGILSRGNRLEVTRVYSQMLAVVSTEHVYSGRTALHAVAPRTYSPQVVQPVDPDVETAPDYSMALKDHVVCTSCKELPSPESVAGRHPVLQVTRMLYSNLKRVMPGLQDISIS